MVAACVAFVWPCALARADEASKQRLLKEGLPALERLQKKYSQIRGSGFEIIESKRRVMKDNLPTNDYEVTLERSRIDFQFDGGSRKLVVERLDGAKPGAVRHQTTCVTPTLSFVVNRAGLDAPAVLDSVGKGPGGNTSKWIDRFSESYMSYPCIALTILRDLFDGKEGRVEVGGRDTS